MSMIMYGGDKNAVMEQFRCEHDWHGPCIDSVSRYYKCKKCFCFDRDLNSMEEYTEAVAMAGEIGIEEPGDNDVMPPLDKPPEIVNQLVTSICTKCKNYTIIQSSNTERDLCIRIPGVQVFMHGMQYCGEFVDKEE